MKYATLDKAGVLTGYTKTRLKGAETVEVPDDCNLVAGKYRWTGSTFDPFFPHVLEQDPNYPIAAGFAAIRDSGLIELPDATIKLIQRFGL